MNDLSPWAASVEEIFDANTARELYTHLLGSYKIKVYCITNTLWLRIECPGGMLAIVRAAYTPTGSFKITLREKTTEGFRVRLKFATGFFETTISFPGGEFPMVRYTTSMKTLEGLYIPFSPRDLVITDNKGARNTSKGRIQITQTGARSGLQYLSLDEPASGSLLYFQNLTALNEYCQLTGTSAGGTVGGKWPEIGFALPSSIEKSIPKGKELILSDAILALSPELPVKNAGLAKQFLDMLAAVYLHLPKPDTQMHDWPGILQKGLKDLDSPACWLHRKGQDYLNAYVCDYSTPPELMVQMAVLLPLVDYKMWSGEDMPVINTIRKGMPTFYDQKLKTVTRFLPSMEGDLSQEEEQLKPKVMDAWYLHHPMLNLCRMALHGDDVAKDLFLKSLPFTIKVAHHFNYRWPVFYNMETLEVIKAETSPEKGGEKDVAGLYALVLLHAWQLTKEKKYLKEAEKAAKTLEEKGFDLFYQGNNTAFSAKALLQLYLETGNEKYLDLSYLCIAGIMKNVQLWECNYGYAKHYNTFFGVFPLNDAPYTAAYEEQEIFAALHDYLIQAQTVDLRPSVKLLLAEFIRFLVQRAMFYYPPNLPAEMLSEEVKMGEVDKNLWIALEDIYDGWEKSGQVGQEVYGAGVAFGIVPRHYHQVKDQQVLIYCDYPVSGFRSKGRKATFTTGGDRRLSCRMVIVVQDDKKMPHFKVDAGGSASGEVTGVHRADRQIEFTVPGNQYIEITW
ncbi:hypothetical protein [Hufsiella ginkgonis]|uniref:Uncharacterized protein n=1 Tax=Hufsiella ginkgonis TaxID=2695274 RepID=A0A7K1Y1I0_9SPHI|nr:hypothetical protein [Hufsiella ginkgonis]MXV16977.1 hypothetical protein [Hufsiella ginkgonis]